MITLQSCVDGISPHGGLALRTGQWVHGVLVGWQGWLAGMAHARTTVEVEQAEGILGVFLGWALTLDDTDKTDGQPRESR